MTIKEKALMIEKYCDSIDDCSKCAIRNSNFTCYGLYDLFPEVIEKNYNIIYGNVEDAEEEKKNEDKDKKMTVEEKAKKIKEYCDSNNYCSNCAIKNICNGSPVYYRDGVQLYPDIIIERNYDIIFGNKSDKKDEKPESKTEDMVNHPSHYTNGGVECIDAITSALSSYEDSVDSRLVGQVIKYLWRAPLKGKYEEDIKKAQFYLNSLVEKIDKKC